MQNEVKNKFPHVIKLQTLDEHGLRRIMSV